MKYLDRFLRHLHSKEKQKQQIPSNIYVGPVVHAEQPPNTFRQNAPHTPSASSEPMSVFAHFMVGVAGSMSPADWERDINEAQKAHIDGFALNIAPQDDYTDRALQTAYDAAERVGGFSLFLSFDYESGGPWPSDRVITTINAYKNRAAQYLYNGKPLVSTFEGVGSSRDWTYIKDATDCIFIPDWTSLAPSGLHTVHDVVDGHFSWDAWPVGAQEKDTSSDEAWINALSGKPYMMPVSPWFYTNLPQWNKNWLWRGDDLWHYRWHQVIELQPALVQILSWNDYGETHYIGPIFEPGIPDGAERYVKGSPHDAWRALLPYYIDAYRRQSGRLGLSQTPSAQKYPISYTDKIVYWYRLNPSTSGGSGGTTGNSLNMGQPGLNPGEVSQDRVFVSVLVTEPSQVHVQIGDAAPTILPAKETGVHHFSVPFDGQSGPVHFAIVRHGREIESTVGPAITEQCPNGEAVMNQNSSLAFRQFARLPETLHFDYQPPAPAPAPEAAPPNASVTSINPEDYSQAYCDFMTAHPTIFHAVDGFAKQLESKGYKYLSERESWTSKLERGGKYYTKRNGSAFIAFSVGSEYESGNGIAIIAGHIDALTAKLKPVSKLPTKAGYVQLGVAPYAGALNKTWWDRDLSIGGRVLVRSASTGKVESKLVKLDWPIARIPSLAEHFGAPAQGPFNKETQMVPIVGVDNSDLFQTSENATAADDGIEQGTFAATQPPRLIKVISKELGITDYSSILDWELELYDSQPARLGGLEKDLIFAGRIDDKLCCYAAQEALIASSDDTSPASIKMVGYFDDEEIGSLLRQGARSNFMSSVIERIAQSFATSYGPDLLGQTVANSFLISSDVIHAVNPNFLNVYLENHAPRLNVGVTVSADSNGHMTTDSVSHGFIKRVAELSGSKIQIFQIRNDSRSGGTIGPMTSAQIGLRAIDVGIPQLSMHSIRATTGSLDPGLGVKLFKGFFDHFEQVDKEFADF
ncbi:glycosyl hydrolase family 71-domain-containing protein [Aspergillus karnatakaensis]|uniref:glycosyl hydrolase family 71-domain-containing protein n=1 Tax=Aspergillus karnatakaensis TaxID=1810916 RepID=UPI003CCDD26D